MLMQLVCTNKLTKTYFNDLFQNCFQLFCDRVHSLTKGVGLQTTPCNMKQNVCQAHNAKSDCEWPGVWKGTVILHTFGRQNICLYNHGQLK